MGINIPGVICVIVMYVVIIAVGAYAAWKNRKSKTSPQSEVIMVAKRDIGWFLGTFTLVATWVGGGYINGSAESIYRPGFGLLQTTAPLGLSLSLFIGATFLAKRMRNANYFTMLDPLQNKLGKRMGALLYLPALLGDMFWSASILRALVIINLRTDISIICSSVTSVVYTLCGGLYAVAYTDVVQLFCMFFGLFLVLPFAMNHPAVGPINHSFYESQNSSIGWSGQWDHSMSLNWIDTLLMLIGGGIPFQAYFQRVLSCRTAKQAQIISYIAVAGTMVVTIPAILVGAIAFSTDWNQTEYGLPSPLERGEASSVLPITLKYLTPAPVAVVGLAGVTAAASELEMLWILRTSILAIGTLACIMALTIESVYSAIVLCADFTYVSLFPQLVGVLYLDVNTYGSLPAFIIGFILRLGGGEVVFGLEPFIHYPGGRNFPFRTFAMLMSSAILISVSYLTRFLFMRCIIPSKYDVFDCRLSFGGRSCYFSQKSDSGGEIVHAEMFNQVKSEDRKFENTSRITCTW